MRINGKQLVKIDKQTIKTNENFGSTSTIIRGASEIHFKCNELPSFFVHGENCYITKEYLYLGDNVLKYRFEGVINDETLLTRCIEEKIKDIVINVNYINQTIYHQPIPKYNFQYENPIISCDSCAESFKLTELLEYDDNEYYSDKLCPKCGKVDCCQLEYEKLN